MSSRTTEMVQVPVTCPACYRLVLVRSAYQPTVDGVEVAREPVHAAIRLHLKGCAGA